ncbi:MAG: SDR family oxidoreductase [Phycisphaerales bacterium JB060]
MPHPPPTHHAPHHRPGQSRRLLITGVAGFLGRHLARVAADAGWEVVGVVRASPEAATPEIAATVRADLAEPRAAQHAIEQLAPHTVIHCAANARTAECEKSPQAAHRDNVLATEQLARACRGIPLVVCSTDLVFDGERPGGMYTEDDATGPLNAYARSKVAMEAKLGELGSRAIIARLPLLFGPPAGGDAPGCFLGAWAEHLRGGKELVLFTDEWRTPLSARDAARGLLACLGHGEPGQTYHLAGAQRVDRYDLGRRFAAHAAGSLGFDEALMKAGVRADVPMPAPRAKDVSLDSTRAGRDLGFEPRPLDDELAWTAGVMAGQP